ncbi:MAG TPA: ABC transporter permease subunit [Ignavibacteriaceae bacterium]|nr:ABC transporter permease subunit [Ignavibacteriaceae bacterium]
MKNILVVSWYTIREAMARKVFIFFSGISGLVVIFTAVILGVTNVDSIVQGFAGKNAAPMMAEIVSKLEIAITTPLASLGLLLAIFASSSFIPIMLEKGNIDLLLSKPVSRTQLLWGKYLGGLLVVFLNIAILIIGVWLSISIKFSLWSFTFLWSILIITFTFAVLYSIIVLFGVITKSSMFGMMIAYLIFLILSPLLKFGHGDLQNIISSEFWKGVIDTLYYIFPKTSELMSNTILTLAQGQGIENYQPLWTSFVFLAAMMFISNYIFNKKDF